MEIIGVSEAGVVVPDVLRVARSLSAEAGLELCYGDPEVGIAFLGRRAHTIILCARGQGWLPTRRPAEAHPITITLAGDGGDVTIVGDEAGEVRVTVA